MCVHGVFVCICIVYVCVHDIFVCTDIVYECTWSICVYRYSVCVHDIFECICIVSVSAASLSAGLHMCVSGTGFYVVAVGLNSCMFIHAQQTFY